VRTRTKARQRAAEALYEAEQRKVAAADVLARNPDVNDYAVALVESVVANAARIDDVIETYAAGWTLARMPAVDRAVLRVAVAELLYHPDIDTAVIASEAAEVAENLSTSESGAFVNGVLGTIGAVRSSLT
jgi:N utilization substance protein B